MRGGRESGRVGRERGSPAGLNNARQNAVGHPSPRFLKRRKIAARVSGGWRTRTQGGREERPSGFLLSVRRWYTAAVKCRRRTVYFTCRQSYLTLCDFTNTSRRRLVLKLPDVAAAERGTDSATVLRSSFRFSSPLSRFRPKTTQRIDRSPCPHGVKPEIIIVRATLAPLIGKIVNVHLGFFRQGRIPRLQLYRLPAVRALSRGAADKARTIEQIKKRASPYGMLFIAATNHFAYD